jgi:hypothetical protein
MWCSFDWIWSGVQGVQIVCTVAHWQAQEFATLHGNVFIQALTAPSSVAGAAGPGPPSPPLSAVAAGAISRLQWTLKAVTADLILVDCFLDWRPTQRDRIRFLLWWQALDAALAPQLVEQELTRFNRDEQAAFCSCFHTGQNVSFCLQDGMHSVSQWRVHGNFAISGARLPFNKTKEPNGPVTTAHIENWIALVTAAYHRSKDRKIWQTRISQGKSRWWHRKT